MAASENEAESGEGDEQNSAGSLSLKDKFWVALAIALFVLLFAAILVFGVF